MTRRARSFAGLCAFLALTFSFGESVWASTCAMPMAVASAEVHDAGGEAPSDSHCATHERPDGEHDGPDDEPCPFESGVAAQACAGVASLPAVNVALPAPASEAMAGPVMIAAHPGLLLETSLFRPPRA